MTGCDVASVHCAKIIITMREVVVESGEERGCENGSLMKTRVSIKYELREE